LVPFLKGREGARMAKRSSTAQIDAGKLFAKLQADKPRRSVTLDDLVRRNQRGHRKYFRDNSFALIEEFVACFNFDKSGHARLFSRPDDSIIELLAERFRGYMNGKGSLDSAFELKQSGTRGRRTARETERLRLQEFGAKMMYEGFRDKKIPRAERLSKDQAIDKIASFYRCSADKIHNLLFRNRSKVSVQKK
jgi:hypothetical protein